MNTQQVVKMLDAITEGREFTLKLDPKETKEVIFDEKGILFWSERDIPLEVTDERTAREIAGALIAWANRKANKSNGVSRAIEAMGYDPVSTQQVAAFDANSRNEHVSRAPYKNNPNGQDRMGTRADWYARSIHLMSQETKDRNLKDLLGIINTQLIGPEEQLDIKAAIQILRDSGAK